MDDGENLSTFCSLPESIPHVITLLSQLLDGKIPRDRIGDPDSVFLISSVCGSKYCDSEPVGQFLPDFLHRSLAAPNG